MADIDPKLYRTVLGHFPTGVTVVTAVDDGEPVGMAIGSFASLSLDPPLVIFCAGKESGSWARLRNAGKFCVNILAEDQKDLCGQMAAPGDKYAGVDWTETGLGSPLLPGVLAHIDCTLDHVLDGGDHEIAVGLVDSLAVDHDDTGPLLFFQGGYGTYQQA